MNRVNLNKRVFPKAGGVVLFFASAPLVLAMESVILPPATTDTDTTPAWADDQTAQDPMTVFVPATSTRRLPDEPFVYGPLVLRPHVGYNFSYSTGVQSGPNQPADTIVQSISPGLTLDLGTHWTLDYTPTLTYYSATNFSNTLSHQASLSGAGGYEDWTYALSQGFSLSSGPLVETAQQTETTDYSTALSGSYLINDRMSASFGVNQDINSVSNPGSTNSAIVSNGSTKTWGTTESLNYAFWARLNVGLSAGAGYVDVNVPNQGNQVYEQVSALANWRATDKLSLGGSVGLQFQQYSTAGLSDAVNPIFSASVQYLPFAHTQISLAAARTVNTSDYYIIASSQLDTSVSLSLNQQLLEKFNLNLSAGYTQTDYTQSLAFKEIHVSGSRTDDGYAFSASLSHSFLKRGSVSVSYSYNENHSSVGGYGFNSGQVGFQVGYSY